MPLTITKTLPTYGIIGITDMRYTLLKALLLKLNKNFKLPIRQRIAWSAGFKTSQGGKIELGNCCHLRKRVSIEVCGGKITLGQNCYIAEGCIVGARGNITIGKGTTIGPHVCIYDHDHDIVQKSGYNVEDVEIGENVWIGAGSIILKGVRIGDGAVVAAGTLVTCDVPPKTLVRDKREKVFKEL